ncbi:MAG: hypothetical protein Q9162_006357 [Coniocarpon cinnabarinum]
MATPIFTRLLRPQPLCQLCRTQIPQTQLRRAHAGFAKKQTDPRPLKHTPRKTTKPSKRQRQHVQDINAHSTPTLKAAATSPSPTSTSPSASTDPSPDTPDTPPTHSPPVNSPYTITRTPSANLPIYLETKRGGNLKQTRIRKISGSSHELLRQLQEVLQPAPQWIRVNGVNGDVLMKGFYRDVLKEWLSVRGW